MAQRNKRATTGSMAQQTASRTVWRIGKFQRLFRRTRLFNWSLANVPAPAIIHPAPDHWRGSASNGSHIITSSTNWRSDSRGFDNFEWLRDLRAFGGSHARSRARQFIEGWVQQNSSWHASRWQPDIMGQRLANLIFLL